MGCGWQQRSPQGWVGDTAIRKNPAEIQSGSTAVGGSGTSAYMPKFVTSIENQRRQMVQTLEESTGPEWSFEMDAAAENSNSSSQRVLHFLLTLDNYSWMLFKVNGSSTSGCGALQIYDQNTKTYSTLSGFANCFTFSDDVATDAQVNHFTLASHFIGDSPTFDISMTDAEGNTVSSTGLAYTQGSHGAGGVSTVTFQTFLSYGDALIDNLVLEDNSPPQPPGDADNNWIVDARDAAILAANWLTGPDATWDEGDFQRRWLRQ